MGWRPVKQGGQAPGLPSGVALLTDAELVDDRAVPRDIGLLEVIQKPAAATYEAVVVCVAHREFREMGAARIRALARENSVLYDIKSLLPRAEVAGRL